MATNLAALAGLDLDQLDPLADERRRRGLTATGQPQPPELAGVRTNPRRPNSQQPMTGEMVRGKEIGGDNAAWPPPPQRPGAAAPAMAAMRPMTGVVRRAPAMPPAPMMPPAGMTMPPRPAIPFGAPTGATSPAALAALPPLQNQPPGLAALPHYAAGGAIPPGGAGVVGDATGNPDDEEVVRALPGGGASVSPVAPPTTLPSQIAGLPSDAPTRAQLLAGIGPPQYGRPPQETSATDRYQKALGEFEPGGDLSADKAPNPEQYKAHGWRRVLGDIAGVAAGALSFSPGAGMLVHDAITGAPYRRAAQNYDQQRRLALAALPDLQQSAKMEGDSNDRQQSQYNADRAFNEQRQKDQQAQQATQTAMANTPAYYQTGADGTVTGAVSETGQQLPGAVPQGYVRPEKTSVPLHTVNTNQGILYFNPATNQYEPVTVNGKVAQPFREQAPQRESWIPEYGIDQKSGQTVLKGYRNPQTMELRPVGPGVVSAKTPPHVAGNTVPAAAAVKAKQAQVILQAGQELINDIKQHADKFGWIKGRINNKVMNLGWNDPVVAELYARLKSFGALQPALHGARGVAYMKEFQDAEGDLQRSPEDVIAAVQSLMDQAHAFIDATKPYQQSPQSPQSPQGQRSTSQGAGALPPGWTRP